MRSVKRILRRFFVVLFATMAISNVVNAASTSTDVQITIEAPENVQVPKSGDDVGGSTKSVQTGDGSQMVLYMAGTIVTLGIVVLCTWKKKKNVNKAFVAVAAVLISAVCMGNTSQAADAAENVDVTIPTNISIVFDDMGTTSISEFEIDNRSLVPIMIEKINAIECNGWQLAKDTEEITVDTKKLTFLLEGKCLHGGENPSSISVPEGSGKQMNILVECGAWTEGIAPETALQLEFEYTYGVKDFQLSFDANGGNTNTATMTVRNGEEVLLPDAQRKGYVFKGWQDENGNVYTSKYIMPIGNVNLTAKWQKTDAYAVYSQDDYSLTFYRSETPIRVGEIHNGKTVTAVYTGMETDTYVYGTVPWRPYEEQITKIEFHDTITPSTTEFWFRHLVNVTYVDVTNLDMSKATSMQYMFMETGYSAPEIYFVGLEDLDVSSVQNMWQTFDGCGELAKTVYLGDLSKWDVSNVTFMLRTFCFVGVRAEKLYLTGLDKWDVSNVKNMSMMFYYIARRDATWSLDLSGWNVGNIELHTDFNAYAESKVTPPKWVR